MYVLRCADGSLYTGWSSRLEQRLRRHRAGKASRYTASRLPVELELALPMARHLAENPDMRVVAHDRTLSGSRPQSETTAASGSG